MTMLEEVKAKLANCKSEEIRHCEKTRLEIDALQTLATILIWETEREDRLSEKASNERTQGDERRMGAK